jgi:hypothetical protein
MGYLLHSGNLTVWKSPETYMETVKRSYRRDYWQSQAQYCEVWSEKATILGAIRPIASELGVTLRVCHGFGSTGMEMQTGEVFAGIDKPITVFYLGDHDPSGHVIEDDIHERAETASGKEFTMQRLAIFAEDIQAFNLPPQRIKGSDSGAASFRQRFGVDAATVELDALPAAELRQRMKDAVSRLIDFELWDRALVTERQEMECIARLADTMKNLPQIHEVP